MRGMLAFLQVLDTCTVVTPMLLINIPVLDF